MQDVLELPKIDPSLLSDPAPAAAPQAAPSKPLAVIDLQAMALSRFGEWRPQATLLVAEMEKATFDTSTTKGYEALTKAIAQVRAPRFTAQNVSEASKSELSKISKAIGAELVEITKFLAPTEARLVAMKTAHDDKVAADKAEKTRLENERKAKHEAKLLTIAGYVNLAAGKTAAQIAEGIAYLERSLVIDPAVWEEFTDRAKEALAQTLQELRAVHASTKAAEDRAAAVAAQEAENARVASELAEQRRQIEADAEALRKRTEALETQALETQPAAMEVQATTLAVEPVGEVAQPATPAAVEVVSINPYTGGQRHPSDIQSDPAGTLIVEPGAPLKAAPIAASQSEPADLTVGAICEAVGFTMTYAFISVKLGVEGIKAQRGSGMLFTRTQLRQILASLIEHLNEVADLESF